MITKDFAAYAVIAILAFAAFGSILWNGAGFSNPDDLAASVANSWNFRPLVMLTYQFNQHVGGWMATNFILHLAAAWLVFLISRSMLAASLFVVHPMAADAVASVSGRSSIILAITVFAVLLAFARFGRKAIIPSIVTILMAGAFTPRVWLVVKDAPGFGHHFARFIAALPLYIIPNMLVPIHLSADPEIRYAIWAFALGLALILALGIAFTFHVERNLRLGIGLFLAGLLPYAFVPLPDVFMEHRGYLALAGSMILVSSLLNQRALLLALGCFIILAHDRADVYSSQVRLWEDAVLKSPDLYRPHLNLGGAYALALRFEDSRTELRRAVALNPKHDFAWGNLAVTYFATKDLANTSRVLDAWQDQQKGQ